MINSIKRLSVITLEVIALQNNLKSAVRQPHNLGILIGVVGGLSLDAMAGFQDWYFFTILGYTLGQLGILHSPRPRLVGNDKR